MPWSTQAVTPSVKTAMAASLSTAVHSVPKLTPSGPARNRAAPISMAVLTAITIARMTATMARAPAPRLKAKP